MRKLLILLALTLASGTPAFAQMDIGVVGIHASTTQTSFSSGWGGGVNIFFRPLGRSEFFRTCPIKFQPGITAYASGAGHYALTRVGTGGPQNLWAQTEFSNVHMGVFADARFSVRNANSRYVPYLDLFGGIRSLRASQDIQQYTDTSRLTLSRYTGFSGGVGLGVMMKLRKNLWLDAGLQWQASAPGGKFVNTKTVSYAGDGITYSMLNAPTGMVLFKLGLSFRTVSNHESAEFTSTRLAPSSLNEF